MKQDLHGNLAGIKNITLNSLKTLYEYFVPRNMLATPELLSEMALLTGEINREVAVYINRRGQVVRVLVGDSATVSLPEVKGRKDPNRLSGIRCIHTHPESAPVLSALDITSLHSLKLDCMAALEVRDSEPGRIQVAYLQPVESRGETVFELMPSQLSEHPFSNIVAVIEKQVRRGYTEVSEAAEKAILVALDNGEINGWSTEDSLAELAELARTAGAEVEATVSQRRPRPDPATFVGRGKARELGMLLQETGSDCLMFDDELSPAQVRNLEALAGCKVIDRTALILDIFAARAKTREGKIQVELAQLKHLLPRLSGLGTILSRLGGGIGTRGPGETKLETDRRHIRRRIAELEKELEGVKRHRTLQRTRRQKMPVVALVGYTNAGKSSLLNALTNANVLAEDKLFATLDPVTRRLQLEGRREILLTDTVGFVRKLPHQLVAAFRATLEEVIDANLLIHVIDASHPGLAEQINAVDLVLQELGVGGKPAIMAFNKIDKENLTPELDQLKGQYYQSVYISAKTGQGLNELMEKINGMLPEQKEALWFIPFARGDILSLIHREGQVKNVEYLAHGIRVRAVVSERHAAMLESFLLKEQEM